MDRDSLLMCMYNIIQIHKKYPQKIEQSVKYTNVQNINKKKYKDGGNFAYGTIYAMYEKIFTADTTMTLQICFFILTYVASPCGWQICLSLFGGQLSQASLSQLTSQPGAGVCFDPWSFSARYGADARH